MTYLETIPPHIGLPAAAVLWCILIVVMRRDRKQK